MTKLEIIVGKSYFTPGTRIVGIAIDGDVQKVIRWADKFRYSRPPAITSGSPDRLRERWEAWAQKQGIEIEIAPGYRKVDHKF